ncbi:class I SAM-dependent methyltransferase [Ramlibacter albus]|uniref:Class I SAM-dependent methyltransferase n=1 Tax=Ramlibacter albus TaxID=2079448 RepID=A0A923MDD6_9BURK|nr:class I SAM-dependent methyltransferase [Ramlibacter albus]MBC5768303.1 class I SAM-dependent methyltransferase [Ramlibacter albus]
MSLLMNALRSVARPRRDEAPPVPAPASAEAPAWHTLGTQTGMQHQHYGDIERPFVEQMFDHVPRRLLDIGCSSGAVGSGLKGSIPGLWVWGCEINPDSARMAATRLDHVTAAPRDQWGEADLALVRTVDTVLMLDVLEHMYNPWAELQFLAANLPDDAQVIVSMPNIGHYSVLQGLAEGAFPYGPIGILDVTHVRFFTFTGMVAMFEETGFDVDENWVTSYTRNIELTSFPTPVAMGKLVFNVASAEEWARLNAIQYGFRLSLKPRR